MLRELAQLDDAFNIESKKIIRAIHGESYESTVFEKPAVFSRLEDRPQSLRGFAGIYVFMVSEYVPLTTTQVRKWADVNGAGFNDWFQGDLHKGDCLYVGSSTKSIYVRIRQHFLDSGENTSLHLGHPKRNMLLNSVTVYAFPIKKDFSKYYRLILTSIEKNLHGELRPKAGSSRV
jgi:hypothetical protein